MRREERRECGERRDAPTEVDLLLKVESSSPPEAMDPCVCHIVNCQHVSQHKVQVSQVILLSKHPISKTVRFAKKGNLSPTRDQASKNSTSAPEMKI